MISNPPQVKAAVVGTSSFYRAMSLFKQGRQAEARELFTAAEAKMKPLPADEKRIRSPTVNPTTTTSSSGWLSRKPGR